jgi:hypothetical protein
MPASTGEIRQRGNVMKKSLYLAATCMLGLGLALTSTTAGLAQSGGYQGNKVVVKKGPVVVAKPQYKAVPQHSGHRHSNRGRNIAAGVAAGVVGAIILNEAARASGAYDGEYSCADLERRCDRGQDWACRRLDRNSC